MTDRNDLLFALILCMAVGLAAIMIISMEMQQKPAPVSLYPELVSGPSMGYMENTVTFYIYPEMAYTAVYASTTDRTVTMLQYTNSRSEVTFAMDPMRQYIIEVPEMGIHIKVVPSGPRYEISTWR